LFELVADSTSSSLLVDPQDRSFTMTYVLTFVPTAPRLPLGHPRFRPLPLDLAHRRLCLSHVSLSLYAPAAAIEALSTRELARSFFKKNFSPPLATSTSSSSPDPAQVDILALMGEERVLDDFMAARRGALVIISVDPISYPLGGGVLLGDAGHSMGELSSLRFFLSSFDASHRAHAFFFLPPCSQFLSTAKVSTAVSRMFGFSLPSSRLTRSLERLVRQPISKPR